MPTRRSTPKPPKVADAKGDLAAQGFRVDDNGPQTSNSLRVQELKAILSAVQADAAAKSYRAAIVEEIALSKYTTSTRKYTASLTTALHLLGDKRLMFKVLSQKRKANLIVQWKPPLLNRLTLASPVMVPLHKSVSEGSSPC